MAAFGLKIAEADSLIRVLTGSHFERRSFRKHFGFETGETRELPNLGCLWVEPAARQIPDSNYLK
jgi:hypothetical protein